MANKGVAYSLSCVLAVLVAAGGYGMAIKPRMEAAEQLRVSVAIESEHRDLMVDSRNRTESVEADFERVAAEASDFNAAFPSASDQSGLLEALNGAAKKAGIKISNISPSQAVQLDQISQDIQTRMDEEAAVTGELLTTDGDPRYTYMTVSLKLVGNENEQRKFLKAVESMDRKLYVQGVSSSIDPSAKDQGDLSLTLITMITAPLVDPTAPEPEEDKPSDESGSEETVED